MARLLIVAGCGVVRIGATLRDVPMTPTVAVAYWDRSVAVAVVVATGGGCNCGKDYGCEVGWGEGGSGVGYLRDDRRGFCDSGGEGGSLDSAKDAMSSSMGIS